MEDEDFKRAATSSALDFDYWLAALLAIQKLSVQCHPIKTDVGVGSRGEGAALESWMSNLFLVSFWLDLLK